MERCHSIANFFINPSHVLREEFSWFLLTPEKVKGQIMDLCLVHNLHQKRKCNLFKLIEGLNTFSKDTSPRVTVMLSLGLS